MGLRNIRGTEGNDSLNGGNGAEEIRGDRGDDIITGNGGDDRLRGEKGNDILSCRRWQRSSQGRRRRRYPDRRQRQ